MKKELIITHQILYFNNKNNHNTKLILINQMI